MYGNGRQNHTDTESVRAPARRKTYSPNQQQGDAGESLVRDRLPPHWVVRSIRPDFGLDLHVEVFDLLSDKSGFAETRGEHFYIQVKSKKRVTPFALTVRDRLNVAKYALDPTSGDEYEIDVVRCSIDTSELLTIEAMGASVPVLLCLADMATGRVHYVCLNDYISKVLLPVNPDFALQKKVTIYIPAWNVLDPDDDAFFQVRFLARRAKLYAAFTQFEYQLHELGRTAATLGAIQVESSGVERVGSEFATMARFMFERNLRLDIFQGAGDAEWAPLTDIRKFFEYMLECLRDTDSLTAANEASRFVANAERCLASAVNLGRMYEEVVREWRLPTVLAAGLDDTPASRYRPSLVNKATS